MKLLKRLFREEEGVTLIEYGLIAAVIAIALLVTLGTVTDALDTIYKAIADAITDASTT